MSNDLFDPYGSLRCLTLRRVEFTDRILHLIRDTLKKSMLLTTVRGAECLTIRSIRTDR